MGCLCVCVSAMVVVEAQRRPSWEGRARPSLSLAASDHEKSSRAHLVPKPTPTHTLHQSIMGKHKIRTYPGCTCLPLRALICCSAPKKKQQKIALSDFLSDGSQSRSLPPSALEPHLA